MVGGATRMIPITCAHIDSRPYHGDSGIDIAQRLVDDQGVVGVATTLNVGSGAVRLHRASAR